MFIDDDDDEDELELPGDDDGEETEEVEDDESLESNEDKGPGPDGETEEVPERQGRVEAKPEPNSAKRRSQTHWQRREAELAATRKRAEEAEARAAQLAAQAQREEAQRLQALQQQREQRRETLTPEERTAEDIRELRGQINFQQQMDAFHRGDAEDKAQYDAKASVNKTYKRYQAEVEKVLKTSRVNGWNIPRAEILANIVGKEVLQVAEQGKPAPARRRAVSKPANSRGDGASTPGRRSPSSDKEALRKRLENVPL